MTAYKLTIHTENVENIHARKARGVFPMICVARIQVEPPFEDPAAEKAANVLESIGRRHSKTRTLHGEYDRQRGEVVLRGIHRDCPYNDPAHLDAVADIAEQTMQEYIVDHNGDTIEGVHRV